MHPLAEVCVVWWNKKCHGKFHEGVIDAARFQETPQSIVNCSRGDVSSKIGTTRYHNSHLKVTRKLRIITAIPWSCISNVSAWDLFINIGKTVPHKSQPYWLLGELELLRSDVSIRFREETTHEGLRAVPHGCVFHASRRDPSRMRQHAISIIFYSVTIVYLTITRGLNHDIGKQAGFTKSKIKYRRK